MAKRTLTLNAERLTELTTAELTQAVGAAITGRGVVCELTDMPTVPDVNRCPTLLC